MNNKLLNSESSNCIYNIAKSENKLLATKINTLKRKRKSLEHISSKRMCITKVQPIVIKYDENNPKRKTPSLKYHFENSFFTSIFNFIKDDVTNCYHQIKDFIHPGDEEKPSEEEKYSPPAMNNEIRIFGNNFYTSREQKRKAELRPIFIDGSNVAFSSGGNKYFSVEGLKTCIDFFVDRGHEVKAFVPQFRQKRCMSSNPFLLNMLVNKNLVITTPSRVVNGKRFCSYDDWFIVQAAALEDGIIVSSDNYRDLMKENPHLIPIIENKLLVPTFVNDIVMFPKDPLGRYGPELETFLRFPSSSA